MRDFRSLDNKVECAKCGRKLPYYELEKGFCLRCRREERELELFEKQMDKEYELLREQMEKGDKLLGEAVKEKNAPLKSVTCAFCGRRSISDWAHYVRGQGITSYLDWGHYVREQGITSYVAEGYVCAYWRCKAKGNSLSDMQPNMGLFVRMLNKIFPLK